jgi:hypothetical protein
MTDPTPAAELIGDRVYGGTHRPRAVPADRQRTLGQWDRNGSHSSQTCPGWTAQPAPAAGSCSTTTRTKIRTANATKPLRLRSARIAQPWPRAVRGWNACPCGSGRPAWLRPTSCRHHQAAQCRPAAAVAIAATAS